MNETLEDKLQNIFGGNVSGTGEEELMRLATKYSLQFHSRQIRILLYLNDLAFRYEAISRPVIAQRLRAFVTMYQDLKQYNNSDMFAMRALDAIALKKFIGENAIKVNVEK